jgi:predicted DNA-binding transcriptional regulator YafY
MALLLSVQRDRWTTASALAAELGVSVRTVHRDVEALQLAGVPLYTAQGAGGGIGIVDRWRSPVEGLSAEEVGALAIGGGAAADLGLGAVLAVARSKLRSGLPASVQHHIDLVNERVLLDTTGWFAPGPPSEILTTLARAVWTSHRLDIRYQRGGREVARRLDPLGLVCKAGVWYLVASHRGAPRTYRASRIASASVLSEATRRPAEFHLERYWQEAADAFDADLRPMTVRLTVPREGLAALCRHVPGRLTRVAVDAAVELGDGRLAVELGVESVEVAADQLCAVPGVEVLDPPTLRQRLCWIGQELAARNI